MFLLPCHFWPQEITVWNDDSTGTAVYPHCGMDSRIGEASSYPITRKFLQKIQKYYFWDSGLILTIRKMIKGMNIQDPPSDRWRPFPFFIIPAFLISILFACKAWLGNLHLNLFLKFDPPDSRAVALMQCMRIQLDVTHSFAASRHIEEFAVQPRQHFAKLHVQPLTAHLCMPYFPVSV